MAIVARGTATSATAAGTTTVSFAVGSEVDRILLVGLSRRAGTLGLVTSVTFNGVELTKLHEMLGTNNAHSLWALVNPPNVTANIVATGSSTVTIRLVARYYSGAAQTNTYGSLVSLNSGTANVALTLPEDILATDLAQASFAVHNATPPSALGANETLNGHSYGGSGGTTLGVTNFYQLPGNADTTVGVTHGTTGYSIMAIPVHEASSGPTTLSGAGASVGSGTVVGAGKVSVASAGASTGLGTTASAAKLTLSSAANSAGASTAAAAGSVGTSLVGAGASVGSSTTTSAGVLRDISAGAVTGISVTTAAATLLANGSGASLGSSATSSVAGLLINGAGASVGTSATTSAGTIGTVLGGAGASVGAASVAGQATITAVSAAMATGDAGTSALAVIQTAGASVSAGTSATAASGTTGAILEAAAQSVGVSSTNADSIQQVAAAGSSSGSSIVTGDGILSLAPVVFTGAASSLGLSIGSATGRRTKTVTMIMDIDMPNYVTDLSVPGSGRLPFRVTGPDANGEFVPVLNESKIDADRFLTYTVSVDMGALAADAQFTSLHACSGVVAGDTIMIGLPSNWPGSVVPTALAPTNDAIRFRAINVGSAPLVAGTETYRFSVLRHV